MKNDPTLPDNLRVYAIGDIHGRHDLLLHILELIKEDSSETTCEVKLVFLGDYIDRGHGVREVMESLTVLSKDDSMSFLQGNHEMMLRDIIGQGDKGLIIPWVSVGGYETCLSYGVPLSQNLLLKMHADEFILNLRRHIPPDHQAFLYDMKSHVVYGDYFFCHAGVRPRVPLAAQNERDLAWIREKFTKYNKPFEKVIVHGHTITEKPEETPYRIGIDTGAYATGKLTALGLEGTKRWFLQT